MDRGCSWCEGDSFFENGSVCMCSGDEGFFGGCDDVSFGSTGETGLGFEERSDEINTCSSQYAF